MSQIAQSARLGEHVSLGDDVIVEDHVCIGIDGGTAPVEIGAGSVIRAGSIIYSGVKAGRRFHTGHHVVIRSETTIGDDVLAGTHVVIDGKVTVGDHVSLQTGVYIPPGSTIADLVFLGPHAVLTNDRSMGSFSRGLLEPGTPLVGPTIGRAARIGANSTVLPEITIGEEAVIGAGAVVTMDIAPRAVAVGVPARVVGNVPDEGLHPELEGGSS